MSIYNIDNNKNLQTLAFEFANMLLTFGDNKPVFLCVGNSNVVADLFGPLCGEILQQQFNIKNVYGTLSHNITGKNLQTVVQQIKANFPTKKIVVLDACLADVGDVGGIKFLPYGCLPAHKTNCLVVGNASFLAAVNVVGVEGLMFLKTVKFKMVLQMVNFVCAAINEGFKIVGKLKNNSNNLNGNNGCI